LLDIQRYYREEKMKKLIIIISVILIICMWYDMATSQPIPSGYDPIAVHTGDTITGDAAGTFAVTSGAAKTATVTVTDFTLTGEAAGDVIYFNGTNWIVLAKGTAGQVLEMNAGATAPEWDEDDGDSYQQVVTVAKSGGDYTTIQGAIDSITDATTTKRYVVRVMSGVYSEAVTCKDYVDILGAGRTNTIISGTSGTVLTFPANKCTVSEVGVNVDYGALGANSTAITSAGADSVLKDCDITVTKSGGDFTMNGITITAGSFRMSDCYFTYTTTGATAATQLTQSAIKQTGVVTNVILNNNEITISTTDTNDDLTGVETTATVTGTCLLANNVITVDAGAAGSSATGIWAYGTSSGAIFNQNRLTVNCNASSYGIWIDSASGGATIDTRHNEIIITSAGAALSAFVAAGDTWNSSLDKITAASGYTNNGTVNFSSSPIDGNFTVTGTSEAGILTEGGVAVYSLNELNQWAGSGSITTVGSVTTGTWEGDILNHQYGGLGANVTSYTGMVAISGSTTSEVDAKSELENQIADVADFAEADGDTWTGVHDMGGATSLERYRRQGHLLSTQRAKLP
jgi:hypothetical protein